MCTRVFWADNSAAKVVSRNMDWAVSDEPELWSLPAALVRQGNAEPNSHMWTSSYASVAVGMWNLGTVDGMNDQGLAAHTLYLENAGWEAVDARPAVANTVWAQYVLDNFDTVAAVVDAVSAVRIASIPVRGRQLGVHLAVEDPSGDSAVIEPIDGALVVHHSRDFSVLTNEPSIDEQLDNLRRYRPFGGELPPPGDITSLDRFVRASYFLHYLPEPATVDEAIAGVFRVASNAAVLPGAPYEDGGLYPTWWTSAADLSNGTYYFWPSESPAVSWVDLAKLTDAAVTSVNPREVGMSGDIVGRFEPATLPY